MLGIIWTIIIGFIAGLIARAVHPGDDKLGFIMTAVLGIAGSFLANFVGQSLGWYKDGRWICYYHPGDITDAWCDDHAGVSPEVWEACYQLGTNVINYANAEYDKWSTAQRKK